MDSELADGVVGSGLAHETDMKSNEAVRIAMITLLVGTLGPLNDIPLTILSLTAHSVQLLISNRYCNNRTGYYRDS